MKWNGVLQRWCARTATAMVEPKQPDDPNPNHTRPTQQRPSLKGVAKQLPLRHRVTFTRLSSLERTQRCRTHSGTGPFADLPEPRRLRVNTDRTRSRDGGAVIQAERNGECRVTRPRVGAAPGPLQRHESDRDKSAK